MSQRMGPRGLPLDQHFRRRYWHWLSRLLPFRLVCWFVERRLNSVFDHRLFQLKPDHRVLQQGGLVSDCLANRILCGRVQVKSDIDHFEEDGVVFKGETRVTPCDSVIMGTGYKISFPFISEDLLSFKGNMAPLYKFQFIPHSKRPETLAFIGSIRATGAIFPIVELQARWFSLLMAGKRKLPSREVMERDIERRAHRQRRQYYESDQHHSLVDWIPFMLEVGGEVGVCPPLLPYLFTDWPLFRSLIFGPMTPYQFRLTGTYFSFPLISPTGFPRPELVGWGPRRTSDGDGTHSSSTTNQTCQAVSQPFSAVYLYISSLMSSFHSIKANGGTFRFSGEIIANTIQESDGYICLIYLYKSLCVANSEMRCC